MSSNMDVASLSLAITEKGRLLGSAAAGGFLGFLHIVILNGCLIETYASYGFTVAASVFMILIALHSGNTSRSVVADRANEKYGALIFPSILMKVLSLLTILGSIMLIFYHHVWTSLTLVLRLPWITLVATTLSYCLAYVAVWSINGIGLLFKGPVAGDLIQTAPQVGLILYAGVFVGFCVSIFFAFDHASPEHAVEIIMAFKHDNEALCYLGLLTGIGVGAVLEFMAPRGKNIRAAYSTGYVPVSPYLKAEQIWENEI